MPDDFIQKAHRTLLQVGELLRNEAYEEAPKDTTDLARSIVVQAEGPLNVAVGPTVDYGLFVHEGTGLWGPNKAPYPIRPRTKKALRFKGKSGGNQRAAGDFTLITRTPGVHRHTVTMRSFGKKFTGEFESHYTAQQISAGDVVVKGVMHPGVKPNPYMERAWDAVREEAEQLFVDELGEDVAARIEQAFRK
jgi:hypothetical protein